MRIPSESPFELEGTFCFYGYVVAVRADPPTTTTTYTSSPKNCPAAVDIRQFPRTVPALLGAVIATEIFVVALTSTLAGSVHVVPLIASPPVRENLKPPSHGHDPLLVTFHVLVKVCPGVTGVLSGIVTSLTKAML